MEIREEDNEEDIEEQKLSREDPFNHEKKINQTSP